MKLYQYQDTSKVILIYLVDTSNNGVTGLTPTVTLSKNGGSFASPTGTVAEVGNGLYKLTPSSADVGTLGPLVVRATGTGAVTYMSECRVVAYDPYDAVRQGMTALPNATAGASGGVYVVGGTGVTVATNNDKTGYKLASDGLDSISTTAPSGVASNFREMMVQVWRRFFRKTTKTSSQIKTYADDGTTVTTTQAISNDGTTQTQGAAS